MGNRAAWIGAAVGVVMFLVAEAVCRLVLNLGDTATPFIADAFAATAGVATWVRLRS